MTKTLLLHCTQPFAQYRNPFTFYYAQSFPLPPKSTIIGMLQNATGRYYDEEFWDLSVSVHGGFESVFWNYSQMIKGHTTLEKGILMNQKSPLYGSVKTSQRSPINMQEMYNGHLWIFIRGDEGIISEIKRALESPSKVLSLGRSEDIIFIKDVRDVEATKKQVSRNIRLSYPTYIKEQKFPIKNNQYPVYSTPTKVLFQNNEKTIGSKTELTKETKRVPEFKTVLYTGLNFTGYLNGPLNVDVFNIGELKFKIPEGGWL